MKSQNEKIYLAILKAKNTINELILEGEITSREDAISLKRKLIRDRFLSELEKAAFAAILEEGTRGKDDFMMPPTHDCCELCKNTLHTFFPIIGSNKGIRYGA